MGLQRRSRDGRWAGSGQQLAVLLLVSEGTAGRVGEEASCVQGCGDSPAGVSLVHPWAANAVSNSSRHCPGDLRCPPESSSASRLSIALSARATAQGHRVQQLGKERRNLVCLSASSTAWLPGQCTGATEPSWLRSSACRGWEPRTAQATPACSTEGGHTVRALIAHKGGHCCYCGSERSGGWGGGVRECRCVCVCVCELFKYRLRLRQAGLGGRAALINGCMMHSRQRRQQGMRGLAAA